MRYFYETIIKSILPEFDLYISESDYNPNKKGYLYRVKVTNLKDVSWFGFLKKCETFFPVVKELTNESENIIFLDFYDTVAEDCLRMYMTCREFCFADYTEDEKPIQSIYSLTYDYCDQVKVSDKSGNDYHPFGSTSCRQKWREVEADTYNMVIRVTKDQINAFVTDVYKGESEEDRFTDIMDFKDTHWQIDCLESLFDEIEDAKKYNKYTFTPNIQDVFQINKDQFLIYFDMELDY